MANEMIRFLRGNVASLPATATPGAVYFTKDEGLYLGLEDGSYHRYGDYIVVDAVASLPIDGAHATALYYCVSENILCRFDKGTGEWIQINKQKTLAQLGGVSQETYNTKIAALEKADTDNATATANLATYVGTIPETATATNIVAYVQEKTAGIATDTALEELTGRVAVAEGKITTIETAIGENGSVTNAIATAKAAGDAAQADVDALEEKVGTVADGKTVVGLISDAQTQANKGVEDAAGALARANEAYTLADGKATMTEVNAAIAGAGHAVKTEVDQAIADMDAAYKQADTDMKADLEGKIGAKVDQTAYDTKMAEMAGAHTTLQGNIDALAGKVGEVPEGSTVMGIINNIQENAYDDTEVRGLIAGNTTAIGDEKTRAEAAEAGLQAQITANATAITTITNGIDPDKIDGLNDLIEWADTHAPEVASIKADIDAVEKAIADQATADATTYETKTDAAQKLVDAKAHTDAEVAKLVQADTDNLAAAKKHTDDEIAKLNIAQYAKQADLDSATGRITTAEGKIADLETESAKHALKTEVEAVQTNLDEYEEANNAAVALKADASVVEAMDAAYKAADEGLAGRIKDLEDNKAGYATTGYVDGKASAAQSAAEATAAGALSAAKSELEGKITSGDETTLASAKSYADTTKSEAIAAAKTETENQVKALNDGQVTTNKNDIASLFETLTWGSF